jgi:hypothetical protein
MTQIILSFKVLTMQTQIHRHPLAIRIPDPQDRTVNDPGVLVESRYVKAFYENIEGFDPKVSNLDRFNYYARYAQAEGWDVQRIGNGALLQVDVALQYPIAKEDADA